MTKDNTARKCPGLNNLVCDEVLEKRRRYCNHCAAVRRRRTRRASRKKVIANTGIRELKKKGIHHPFKDPFAAKDTPLMSIKARGKIVKAFKEGLGCSRCNDKRPYLLQFHHTKPDQKYFAICEWAKTKHLTIMDLFFEIAKCDVYCTNCHIDLHWKENQKKIKVNP